MRSIKSFIITACAALAAVSCTVKEDRALAPCWLVADMSPCSGSAVLYGDAMSEQFCDTVDTERLHEYVKAVPRGRLDFTAVLMEGDGERALSTVTEGKITCREGQMFPRVRMYRESFVTLGQEEVHTVVIPHKRWCDIRMVLPKGMVSMSEMLIVQVQGTSVGYSLSDGSVIKGNFTCTSRLSADGTAVVSVPQQWSDDLFISVFLDGVRTKSIPLGELLRGSGYDWSEPDLKDVTYILEVENTSGTIVIGDWDIIENPVENPEN